MKKTQTIVIQVELPTPSKQEAKKAGIVLANKINGELIDVYHTQTLPF